MAHTKEWRSSMKIRFDYNNMMQAYIGEHGITDEEIFAKSKLAKNALNFYKTNRGTGMMCWSELPYNQTEIVKELNETARYICKKFKNFVVLGIGGSALGPIAVFQALNHLRNNELPRKVRKVPKLYVEDNVDPERMASLLDVIDVEETMFNVITKSGSTSETMSQFLIISDILKKKLGDRAKEHIIATTSENKGNLIKIAQREGYKTFYIPDGVGGRFSELCPVGLLTAAVMGVSVMMPYADGLKYIADWYCQLWGESLGKRIDLDGKEVFAGQTPVKALGVTDQHSQIQLYIYI